jgi:hypothetical protein
MPYIVTKSNGTKLTVIQDGSLDKSTDLTFVGKNYAGYGQIENENLVKLLENFANNTNNPPSKPLAGQLWYDTQSKTLNVFDGSQFVELMQGQTVDTKPRPTSPKLGDFWWDPLDQKLYIFNGYENVLIGPAGNSSPLISGVIASTVRVSGGTKNILKATTGGKTVAVFSKEDITPLDGEDIKADFPRIVQGITLPNAASNGVTQPGFLFFGTAADAALLGGAPPGAYVKVADFQAFSGNLVLNSDDGILVGQAQVMRLHAKTRVGYVSNVADQTINFNVQDASGSATSSTVVTMTSNGGLSLSPGSGNSVNLGLNGNAFADTYSTVVHTRKISTSVTDNVATTGTIIGNWTVKGTISLANADSAVSATFANTSTNAVNLANSNNTGFIHTAVDGTANTVAQIDTNGALNISKLAALSGGSSVQGAWTLATNASFQATSIQSGTSFVVPDATATGNTLALRDTDGGITAAAIKGTSLTAGTINAGSSNNSNGTIYGQWTLAAQATLQATYADIAERYASDREYNPGTVLVIGGTEEVTLCLERAAINHAGIVSTNPAFKLNGAAGNDATHPFIALKGRLPCMVVGPVKKGELLVTSKYPGHAEAWQPGDSPLAVIGKALASCGEGPTVIEVMV